MKKGIICAIAMIGTFGLASGAISAATPDETVYGGGYYKNVSNTIYCQANFGYPTSTTSTVNGYTNSVAPGDYTVTLVSNAYPTANDLIYKTNCQHSYGYADYDGTVSMNYNTSMRVRALNNTHAIYNPSTTKYNVYLFDTI
jgi:hypothetical protein